MKYYKTSLWRCVLVNVCIWSACGGNQSGASNSDTSIFVGDEAPALQSNDVLAREQKAATSHVKHILIGWRERSDAYGGRMDERAAKRTREEADQLVQRLYQRVKNGEKFTELMEEYSEDPGSAATGESYEVVPGGQMVFEFRRLALRLDVNEVGIVLSQFGWHIMQRVQ